MEGKLPNGKINTVLGSITGEDLGFTYIHEHLITDATRVRPEPDLTMNSISRALAELSDFAEAGGKSLVEGTAIDYGRNVFALKEIARQCSVNIIPITGFNKGPYFPQWVREASCEYLADFMAREVLEGIDDSDIKASVIKAGTSYEEITPDEEKVLRAVARAGKLSGAPIYTHTEAGTMGVEQLNILEQEGVDLTRVMIGHLDRLLDLQYHLTILQRGAWVVYDQVGKTKYYSDTDRVNHIVSLVEKGYGDRILLAGDMGRRSYLKSYGGGPGFSYIITEFIPILLEAGLTEEQVHSFFVDNPRYILSSRSEVTENGV